MVVDVGRWPGFTCEHAERLLTCQSLEFLSIGNTEVDSRIWGMLSGWPSLKAFLVQCKQVSDNRIAEMPQHNSLRSIAIDGSSVTNAGLELLASRFPNLDTLDIANSPYFDAILATRFPLLKELSMSADGFSIDLAKQLSQNRDLQKLVFTSEIFDRLLRELSPLESKLKTLVLFHNTIQDRPERVISSQGYIQLTKLTQLEELYMSGATSSPIDDQLLTLATTLSLKSLSLSFPSANQYPNAPHARRLYTEAGIEAFRRARSDVRLIVDGKAYEPTQMQNDQNDGKETWQKGD